VDGFSLDIHNCGYMHDDVIAKVPIGHNENDISISCVGYALKCEVQGKIYIRARVASVPARRPF